MSVLSMTGFGTASFELEGVHYRIEARAVNHKGLSARFHLPPELSHVEPAAQTLTRERLGRGAIDVNVQRESGGHLEVDVDRDALQTVMLALGKVAASCGASMPSLDTALRIGNFVRLHEHRADPTTSESTFLIGLGAAYDALVAMRRREGESLRRDLEARLDAMAGILDAIAADAPRVLQGLEERLRQKVADTLARHGLVLDDARVLAEIVVLADKSDVTEEIVRARAHIAAFRDTLQAVDTERGRRLDFLVQEILREWNTLGSKCRDAAIAQQVVDAKVELEKVREQVQNIA